MKSKKILIFGAGSIGNHMAYAARRLNLNVFVTDISESALDLMKNRIYPHRYKKWDKKINLINYNSIFKNKNDYDLVIIGTPPKNHLNLFFKILKFIKFKKILIEKPLTNHLNKNLIKFNKISKNLKNKTFIGYNHSISKSFLFFISLIKKIDKSKINEIDVNWKESWHKIMAAHFWIKKFPKSYISNFKIGGGSLHEHSHGLHLLILILDIFKINITQLRKLILFGRSNKTIYDKAVNLQVIHKKMLISYNTNLISNFVKKEINIYHDNSNISWINRCWHISSLNVCMVMRFTIMNRTCSYRIFISIHYAT